MSMDSPSSSASSDTSVVLSTNCQICLQPAHGKHFGAMSCRACSAFFRRAYIGKYDSLKCRKKVDKCKPRPNGRFGCRKCRLEKCYDAGMSVDLLQFDRDILSSTNRFAEKRKMITNIPHSPENFLGRPSFIFSCEPELASSSRTVLDVQFMIDHAFDLFTSITKPREIDTLNGKNTLERLTYAMEVVRRPSTEEPIVCTRLGKEECLILWECKFMAAANWLTYCDEFQQLPTEMKIKCLKGVWYVWMKIEKIAKIADYRARKIIEREHLATPLHIFRNAYIDMDNADFDTSWISNYEVDQLRYFLNKPNRVYQSKFVEQVLDMRASHQEVTYLLCVVAFRYTAKQNPGTIADMAEKIIDKLANDLHTYYFNELKMTNYASRLAQLMKIAQDIQRALFERQQRAEIAKLFDVFSFEFSHPEMFIGI